MEKFVERVISSLITNQQYWLVWFPTTLDGEAYEWYRDHDEGHFQTWDQLQREFLNEFRPEVGQSMAFRALMTMRQGRDEEISAYIRRFDWVCARWVGDLLNDDTLIFSICFLLSSLSALALDLVIISNNTQPNISSISLSSLS